MEVALSQTKSTLLVRLRPLMVAAVGYALFVLAVYWPEPRHLSWLWVLVETKWSAPGQTDWTAARIAPLAPQLLYLTCAPLYLFRLKIVDYAVTTIARILVIIAFLNLLITPTFTGTFSTEAAAGISWLVNASLFAWMLLFCSIGNDLREDGSIMALMPLTLPSSLIVAIVTWSVVAGMMAALQASLIANGRPYCIATDQKAGPYVVITSPFNLMGSKMFTDRTGYRDSHRCCFHAALVVDGTQGQREYWNWSVTRMTWQPIQYAPSANLRRACEPETGFLSHLKWF